MLFRSIAGAKAFYEAAAGADAQAKDRLWAGVGVSVAGDRRLTVRYPHSEEAETARFAGVDPYLAENTAFVSAVRTGDRSLIRSTLQDALRTFELTWAITDRAAE